AQIEPRTTRPVPVAVGDATSTVDPDAAGLSVDWTATIAQAEHQPLNPITRIESFFTTREVGVVTKADPAALDAALAELKPAVDKPAVEGNVRFEGITPQRVEPVAGQQLDVPAATAVLTRDWVSGAPVALPLIRVAPTTTSENVTAALAFRPDPAAGLARELNLDALTKVLKPQLAASETPGRDATLDFSGGAP